MSSVPSWASIGHVWLACRSARLCCRAAAADGGVRRPPAARSSRSTEARHPEDDRLLACLDLGRSRTLYQDPSFGIRQLVDVATQALSPAINQPSTAVQVIDRLHDLLLRIARAPMPTGFHADAAGVVRVVEPTLTPAHLLLLAYQEVSQLGASSWHVTRRLAAAYEDLGAEAPDSWKPTLTRLRESLERRCRAQDTWEDGSGVQPDRLGLG